MTGFRMRYRDCGDDRGSLVFAMLVTIIGIAVTALLLPIAITQIGSTREENRRSRAVSAAQAGLDVALGHIQAANDGTVVNGSTGGVLSALPCGPLTGAVSAGNGAGTR